MLDDTLLSEINRLQRAGTAFCLAAIVDGGGSIPQIIGAAALFTAEGLACGTVGGGALEESCRETARELLSAGGTARTRFRKINLQKDLGMTCGGWVSVYFEVGGRALGWNVAIFGAGHIAQVLCRFLAELDCRVTCIDTRPEWLERLPRSAKLEAVRVADFPDGLARVVPGSDVLVMTMGHGADAPILRSIHARGLAFAHLGVVGSGGKAKALRDQLLADGLPADFVARIVCPLGDKLGNNTPPEIALGIVSQLLRLRQAAPGSVSTPP